jgi:hypothetical protein
MRVFKVPLSLINCIEYYRTRTNNRNLAGIKKSPDVLCFKKDEVFSLPSMFIENEFS